MKKLAQTFKALSDETRLRILALLTQGELCVCDLMAILQLLHIMVECGHPLCCETRRAL